MTSESSVLPVHQSAIAAVVENRRNSEISSHEKNDPQRNLTAKSKKVRGETTTRNHSIPTQTRSTLRLVLTSDSF